MAAFKQLKRDRIAVRVVTNLDDAAALLIAERDENTCRKDFTPSEAVALGAALEELERPKAAQRMSQKPGGKQGEKVSSDQRSEQTRDKVGQAVGMSGPTYQRAKAVVAAAKDDPAKFGEIAEEMDRTGKVQPAYDKVREKQGRKPKPKTKKQLDAKDFFDDSEPEPSKARLSRLIDLFRDAEKLCFPGIKELNSVRSNINSSLRTLIALEEKCNG